MHQRNIKGIFTFDIDGTLTHRIDWIHPKVVNHLGKLEKEGWLIAFVTGKTYSFASTILEAFAFPYLVAIQNGADIFTHPEQKNLARNYLNADILPLIEEAYSGIKGDFILYSGIDKGDFCFYRKERFSEEEKAYLNILEGFGKAPWQPSDFRFSKETGFPLIKCFGTETAMKKVHERLQGLNGIEISLIRDPVDPSLYLNLITHPKANKGAVIDFLREKYKSPLIIAAGDDRNDLKMLKNADIAIAINTAPDEILEIADIFAKPAFELGIIEAVEEAIRIASN